MRVFLLDARVEGSILCDATRVLHGQVFARDFFEVIGPGSIYWTAAFFKLFGPTFLATRVDLFVSSLGTGLALYFLSRQVCTRYQALPTIILAAIYFGGSWPAVNHHVDSNFFGLASVVTLLLGHRQHKSYLLIATGCLAAITSVIHQPKGILLFCAFVAWLWLQRRNAPAPLAAIGSLAQGYLATTALVLAYFWSQGALHSLIYANFLFPFHHYGTVNRVRYAHGILQFYWTPWTSAKISKWFTGIAVIVITPALFIAALPLLLCFVGIRYPWKSVTPEISLYWLSGWAFWFSEIHRKEIWHLAFGSPLLILLCVHALTESKRKQADLALGILAISAICLATINSSVALASGFHTSRTRVGTFALVGQGSTETLKYLNENVPAGEAILCYPYCPAYYFLSATTNPTRYSLLAYNYNTPAQFREVVDVLSRQRVKYVLWDVGFAARTATIDLPGSQPNRARELIIEPYLASHYKVVEDSQGIRIMERID
jgi:hypothetical protein